MKSGEDGDILNQTLEKVRRMIKKFEDHDKVVSVAFDRRTVAEAEDIN